MIVKPTATDWVPATFTDDEFERLLGAALGDIGRSNCAGGRAGFARFGDTIATLTLPGLSIDAAIPS